MAKLRFRLFAVHIVQVDGEDTRIEWDGFAGSWWRFKKERWQMFQRDGIKILNRTITSND